MEFEFNQIISVINNSIRMAVWNSQIQDTTFGDAIHGHV